MCIKVKDVVIPKNPESQFKDKEGEVHFSGKCNCEETVFVIFHKSILGRACDSNIDVRGQDFFADDGYVGVFQFKRSDVKISLRGYSEKNKAKIESYKK